MTLDDLNQRLRVNVTCFTGYLETKQFLTIFDNISDTIHSSVMRHGPNVARGRLQNDVTLGDID